jgi:hypothetical protein
VVIKDCMIGLNSAILLFNINKHLETNSSSLHSVLMNVVAMYFFCPNVSFNKFVKVSIVL